MHTSFKKFLEARRYWGSRGAGVLAFATDAGKWLVALRSDAVQEPNTWGVVGGKIDDEDADPQEAARREFMEETGYRGPISMHEAHVWRSPEVISGRPKFTYHNFIGTIVKGDWEPQTNWETEEFAWVSLRELLELRPKHFGLKALVANSTQLMRGVEARFGSAITK